MLTLYGPISVWLSCYLGGRWTVGAHPSPSKILTNCDIDATISGEKSKSYLPATLRFWSHLPLDWCIVILVTAPYPLWQSNVVNMWICLFFVLVDQRISRVLSQIFPACESWVKPWHSFPTARFVILILFIWNWKGGSSAKSLGSCTRNINIAL
jgi:hypothetical protein